MLTRNRRSVMLYLAALSVVGVLSMHGLDPVVTSVDQSHSSHASATETGVHDHAAMGLCVFVAAVATLGLAAMKRVQTTESFANLVYRSGRFARTRPVTMSGSPLLYRLCVLRL